MRPLDLAPRAFLDCIAAPIHAGSGRVVAELGLAGPTARLQARRAELGRMVCETAARISTALGYRPGPRAEEGGRR
jgi:DNA-binding IclR family transcriptional regulator